MVRFVCVMLSLVLVAGCSDDKQPNGKKSPPAPAHLVETTTVTTTEVAQTLVRSGTLRARRETKIITQEEGRLTNLPFYEGDQVEESQTLFSIEDTQLRAELKKAIAQRKQAAQDLKRLQRLQNSRVVAEDELARAKTALDVAQAEEDLLRIRLSNTKMAAPFSGVISERLVEPGDALPRFTHILTLTDPASLVTEVTVSELFLPQLRVGDDVSVRIDALGRENFPGRIQRIHPTVDPASRQGTVEVVLEPAPARALPGQLCRVTLTARPQPRLLIPFAALQRDLQGEYLFAYRDGKAVRIAVESGAHFGDQVEIVTGLDEGAQVVTKGIYGVSDGMKIKAIAATVDRDTAKP